MTPHHQLFLQSCSSPWECRQNRSCELPLAQWGSSTACLGECVKTGELRISLRSTQSLALPFVSACTTEKIPCSIIACMGNSPKSPRLPMQKGQFSIRYLQQEPPKPTGAVRGQGEEMWGSRENKEISLWCLVCGYTEQAHSEGHQRPLESENHIWVGRDFKNQLLPTSLHRQGYLPLEGHLPIERCYDGKISGISPYVP